MHLRDSSGSSVNESCGGINGHSSSGSVSKNCSGITAIEVVVVDVLNVKVVKSNVRIIVIVTVISEVVAVKG